jgi:hypothetical protein
LLIQVDTPALHHQQEKFPIFIRGKVFSSSVNLSQSTALAWPSACK